MRKRKLLCLLPCVLLLFALFCIAVSAERACVCGNGSATLKADTAFLCLGVKAEGADEASAAKENRTRTDALRKLLGTEAEISETGYYTADLPESERVRVTRTFCVRMPAGKLSAFLEGLTDGVGFELYGVSCGAENTTDAELSALKAAVAEAKKKAEALGITGEEYSLRECESFLSEEGERITVHTRVELCYGSEPRQGVPIPRGEPKKKAE